MAQALNVPRVRAPTANQGSQSCVMHLAVPEMHCGGCMRKVEAALAGVPGVESVRANLSAKRVAIVAQTRAVESYLAALRAVGFEATALPEAKPAESERHEDIDLLKRLGVAGFATANVMLLSVSVWSGHASDMPASLQTLFHWLSALIALPAIAYAGQPFFRSARSALSAGRLNMDVPISLGVTLATVMSLYQTMRGSEQVYFDAAITLLFFLLVGRVLDQRMRQKASSAAENLLGLRSPSTTIIASGGAISRVATSDVRPGQRILVAAGERVSVDARVLKGVSELDDSLITGESRPRQVMAGDVIYCGTINLAAPIEAEATGVADNTLLSEIARLMMVAEQGRGRYVRLADRAARLYAPSVHVLGALTFAGWLFAGQGWEPALTAAIAVLIITCPCALALAVPAVQVVATSRLFSHGVVLKAADGLERLAEIDTVILDKTGTLTLGEPRVLNADAIPDAGLLRAAKLAAQSRHPYARAVVRAARARGLDLAVIEGVREIPGAGLIGEQDGRETRLGSAAHCGVAQAASQSQSVWFRDGAETPFAFVVADPMRDDARETVAALSRQGYCVEILSGDRVDAVSEAARTVGIARWRAALQPGEKLDHIAKLAQSGRKVLMVGDGLNDAPALAAGHASLTPANAADISQTAADGVLQGEAMAPVVETLRVAKAARRLALENFAIAIGYNVVFVPMAMAGLVTPLIAAIAMSASSIAVTLNALRLARDRQVVR